MLNPKTNRSLAVAGLLVIITALGWIATQIVSLEQLDPDFSRVYEKHFAYRFPPCKVNQRLVRNRKPLLHQSFDIIFEVLNPSGLQECQTRIQVSASAFDIKPDSANVVLKPNSSNDVRFSVLPNYPGPQGINLWYGEEGDYTEATLQFLVYQYPYVPPGLSLWFPVLGFFFGGTLTVPWWLEFRQKRKSEPSSGPESAAAESRSGSVQQTASPVVVQNASPVVNVNVGGEARPVPRIPSPAPSTRPNIRFVEVKSTSVHATEGRFYESPQGLGDFRVAVAFFRNDGIVGETVQQPRVSAHLIYKDFNGHEIANVDRGVWLQEYKDAVHLGMGTKRGVIVMLLTNQGTLKRLWKESYTTEHSWMSGEPSFRVVDDVIPRGAAAVEINLLDVHKGECFMQVRLRVDDLEDGKMPNLVEE